MNKNSLTTEDKKQLETYIIECLEILKSNP